MKQLILLVHSKLKKGYYYQELTEISAAGLVIAAAWFLYNYGPEVFRWVLSYKGMIWCTYFMVGIVIALVIKIYYRIQDVKYHEKDTRIELFSELESNK